MVKLLIYAYAVGIFSSRKIAQALDDLVPLRYLAAGNRPRHRTLARFREAHCAEFQALFVQVVRIGMTFAGISVFAQQIVFGFILVAAVAITMDRAKVPVIK